MYYSKCIVQTGHLNRSNTKRPKDNMKREFESYNVITLLTFF